MKKSIIFMLLGSGVGLFGGVQNAFAVEANPTAELTSEASLNIQAGILSLDRVSNFDFGTLSIKDIADSDQSLSLIHI